MSKRVKIFILVAAIIGVLCIGGGVLYSRNSVSQQSAKSNNEENISGSEEAENSSGASSGALISSGIENPSGLENNSGAENPSGIKSENEINRDLQNKEKELKTAKEKTEKQLYDISLTLDFDKILKYDNKKFSQFSGLIEFQRITPDYHILTFSAA